MKKQENITVELWRLADGDCSPEERQTILQKIDEQKEWSTIWEEVKLLSNALQEIPIQQPSALFRKQLLTKVPIHPQRKAAPDLLSARAKWLFAGGFIALTLIAALGPGKLDISFLNLDYLNLSMDMSVWSVFENSLPSISTAILLLGTVSLLLFDRLVLVNLFDSRKL